MRRTLHLCLMASLLAAFARAPFHHAHADDPDHRHARGFSHAHWKRKGYGPHHQLNPETARAALRFARVPQKTYTGELSWEGSDHDSAARLIDWLAGNGKAPQKFTAIVAETVREAVLPVYGVRPPELRPRSHDPPWPLIPHLRGPPC